MTPLKSKFILFTLLIATIPSFAFSDRWKDLSSQLSCFVSGKDAKIGVAVVMDDSIVVNVNGDEQFPMLSVYKFPLSLAVADFCEQRGVSFQDTLAIPVELIKSDTWSPLREKYGVRSLQLPIDELLVFALSQSDNNACDILFDFIGGPAVADSLIKTLGFTNIQILSTEDEMHRNTELCYENHSTPVEMARLMYAFKSSFTTQSKENKRIAEILESCKTGTNRLAAPLKDSVAIIGHKTGTGDTNPQGRIIGINDVGYIVLPDGRFYSIAVFISDSGYDFSTSESLIGDISALVYRFITQ